MNRTRLLRLPRGKCLLPALVLAALFALPTAACVHAPANLTPQAAAAFTNTRVIRGLDLLRNTAVDANTQIPPLVSTATMLRVVRYHQGAVKTIDALTTDWQTSVRVGLDELLKNLPARDQVLLGPYIALANTLLTEATR